MCVCVCVCVCVCECACVRVCVTVYERERGGRGDGSALTSLRAATLRQTLQIQLSTSRYTDTRPTSPRADPITPDAWQGSHWSANFEVTGMTGPRKLPSQSGIQTPDLPLFGADALTTWPTRRWTVEEHVETDSSTAVSTCLCVFGRGRERAAETERAEYACGYVSLCYCVMKEKERGKGSV